MSILYNQDSGRTLNAIINNSSLFRTLVLKEDRKPSEVERWLYLCQDISSIDNINIQNEMEYWLYFLHHGKCWEKKPHLEDTLSSIDLTMLISNNVPIQNKKNYIQKSKNPLIRWLILGLVGDHSPTTMRNYLSFKDLEPHIYFNTPTTQRWLGLKHPDLFAEWVVQHPKNVWDIQALHTVFVRNKYNGDNKNLLTSSVADMFINTLPIKTIINMLKQEQIDWLINPKISLQISTSRPKRVAKERLNIIIKECPFLLARNLSVEPQIDQSLFLKWINSVQSQMHIYRDEHFKVILPAIQNIIRIESTAETKEKSKFTLIVNTIKSLYDNPQEQAKAFLLNFNRVEAELQSTPMPDDTYDYKQPT